MKLIGVPDKHHSLDNDSPPHPIPNSLRHTGRYWGSENRPLGGGGGDRETGKGQGRLKER